MSSDHHLRRGRRPAPTPDGDAPIGERLAELRVGWPSGEASESTDDGRQVLLEAGLSGDEIDRLLPDLLAWIEGGLTPRGRARLDRAVGHRPEVVRLLRALRDDHRALAALPEPRLDRDLVAALEPTLARPMLVGAGETPGVWRRRHRRAAIAGRITSGAARLAAAAAVAIVVGGGLLFAGLLLADPVRGLVDDLRGGPERIADATTAGASLAPAPATPRSIADDRLVHHAAPLELPAPTAVSDATHARKANDEAVRLVEGPVLRPAVVLVVDAAESDAEDALLAALARLADADAALVRNLSRAEVDRWLARRDRRPLPDSVDRPLRAGGRDTAAPVRPGGEPPLSRAGEPERRRERNERVGGEPAGPPSGVLHGDERLAPPGDVQVARSVRGETWTLVVPARDAAAFLAALDAATDGGGRLDVADRPGLPDVLRAAEARERLRRLLADAAPDAMIELAVRRGD